MRAGSSRGIREGKVGSGIGRGDLPGAGGTAYIRPPDLLARLKNSRDTEQRFRAILQQRTGNVSEVLQVEEGIARVRSDIERMEAEQKALEHRVDFATIEL